MTHLATHRDTSAWGNPTVRPTAVGFKHSRDLFRLKGLGRKRGKEGGGRKEVERKSGEERGRERKITLMVSMVGRPWGSCLSDWAKWQGPDLEQRWDSACEQWWTGRGSRTWWLSRPHTRHPPCYQPQIWTDTHFQLVVIATDIPPTAIRLSLLLKLIWRQTGEFSPTLEYFDGIKWNIFKVDCPLGGKDICLC